MPADERRLVELASVVGPEFALGAVAAIAEPGAATDLRLTFERLRRRELVESSGAYWGDEPIYRFHHVLIRDAAYRRLLKRARADLHLRVGEWTERTAAELPGEHEVAIAYHYEQVHEYRCQLDDVDDTIAAVGLRAAELLGVAAERALERDDLQAASTLAERALARLDEADPIVPPTLIVAAEALLGLGDVAAGRPVVDRLVSATVDDERLSRWADAFVAQLLRLTEPDRLREVVQLAESAAERLAALGDEAGVAKARLVRASALGQLGQVGECEAELDLALTAARSAGDDRRVTAVLGAAPEAALWGPSPIPRAGGRCLDVVRLLRITTGSPAVEATSTRCQAVLEALRGRFDTARSMLADSRATVEELGLRHALALTDLYAGIVELLAGDAATAELALRSAHRGLGRLGIGAEAGLTAAYLARALLQLDRVDEAEKLAAESAELAGENPQTAIAARTAQAEILAAQGRYHDAVTAARAAVARAEGTDIIVDHAAASAVLAQVAALAGDDATASRASVAAAELNERKAATTTTARPHMPPRATPAPSEASAERSVDGADAPWNEADRLARGWVEFFTAGERERWLPLVAPDQVTRDLRPLVGVDTSGVDGVADAYPRDENTRGMTSRVETLATRGDRLALIRWRARSGSGREWDMLHVNRWTEAGQNDLNVIFPVDQLGAAVDELDRLYLETVPPSSPEAMLTRVGGAAYGALRHGDLDAAMAMMSDRYVQRDYRSLAWPTVDWAGMRERLATMIGAGANPWLARVHRIDGLVALWQAEVRVTGEHGAEQTDRHLLISVTDPDSGLIESNDQFSLDQFDEALRRFDERVAEVAGRHTRWNASSIAGAWLATAERLGRPELAPGMVRDGVETPAPSAGRQVLALGGQVRALVALLDADDVPVQFVVEELDGEGFVVFVGRFGADDLAAASAEADRRWYESLDDPTEADAVLIEYVRAWQSYDAVRLAEVVDESFVGADLRPLVSNPGDGKAQQLANVELFRDSGSMLLAIGEPLARSDVGSLIQISIVGRDVSGRLTESLISLGVSIVRNGRVVRAELFPSDDEAAARRRFDELTGVADTPGHEPWSEADRLARQGIAQFFSSNSEDRYRYLHPDHVSEDRRPLVGYRTEGRDDISNLWDGTATDGTQMQLETIAVRGDHLVLYRVGVASPRAEFDFLHLDRWTDDGLHDLLIRFDLDQLPEAIDELNRLHLDELGDTTAGLHFGVLLEGVDLVPGGDIEGFLALHAPEFVMRDHRSIGWGELRLDEYAERLRSIVDVPGEVQLYQERFHALEEVTLSTCLSQNLLVRFADGSEQSSRSVMVMMMDPITGLITSMDQFAEDDVEIAMECFERLLAERGRTLYNDATMRANLVNFWLRRGDDGPMHRVITEDSVFIGADGEPFELEPVERREVMAVRGDRLGLVQLSVPSHAFVVEEIDHEGRLVSVTRFAAEQINDAATLLDERWIELEGDRQPAVMRTVVDYSLALNRADTDALEGLLHDDHEVIDHRPIGWPRLDRVQVLTDVGAQGRESETSANVTSERLATNAAGALGSVASWRVFPDGASTQGMVAHVVVHVVDGQVRSSELFDDLGEARARFDALGRAAESAVADTTAVRTVRRIVGGLNDHTFVQHRREFTAPGYTHTDHRPLIGHEPKGVDELIPLFVTAGQVSLTFAPLEVRGDRFVLWQGITTYENGAESAYLGVADVDGDGRALATVFYDFGDLDRARADLDHRWLESLGERRQAVSRLAVALGEAWVAPSTHPFDDLLAPDFEVVDGRTLGMGTMDRAGFEHALLGREADGTTGPPVPSRVEFVSDDVMVFRANNLGHVPGSGIDWEEIACNVLVAEGDRIARIEMFDEHAWADATARARELGMSRSGEFAAPNIMHVAVRLAERAEAGDLDGLRDCFEPDFERHDSRRVVSLPDMDRDQYVADLDRLRQIGWTGIAAFKERAAMRDNGLIAVAESSFDGATSSRYAVLFVEGATGRLARMLILDEVDIASGYDELDRAWLPTLETEEQETYLVVRDSYAAYVGLERDRLDAMVADGFTFVDHRQLGFGRADRAGFFDLFESRRNTRGSGASVVKRVHLLRSGVIVYSTAEHTVGEDGSLTMSTGLFVSHVAEGQLARTEIFPDDRLDDALALAAAIDGPGSSRV